MSKVYPRHGYKTAGAGGPERIRPQQQQQPRQAYTQQRQQQSRQQSRQTAQDDLFWPLLITALCSIPVIFILWNYFTKLMSKIIWGSLPISVEVSGPRLDHPNSASEAGIYQWLMDWFSRNLKNLQNASVLLNKRNGRLVRYPGFGVTIFQYKGATIKLDRIPTPEIRCNDIPYEKVILSFVSSRRSRTLLYELLEECRPSSKKKKLAEGDERTVMYEVDPKANTCWKAVGTIGKKKRELSTVILGDNSKQKLVDDVKEFLDEREWYTERGIPYRRGYLFHGPPGCGKSTLAKGIAGEFGFDICSLSLSSERVNDDNLTTLMTSTPDNCILVVEDVDIVMHSVQRALTAFGEPSSGSSVTLTGLLNAIDGVVSPSEEGKIMILTTSQVEKLDPALTRPGRVDMKLFLGYPNDDQLRALFGRFYPEAGIKTKSDFVKRVRELGLNVTMAQMQGLFVFCKKDGAKAIDKLREYFRDQFTMSELEPNK